MRTFTEYPCGQVFLVLLGVHHLPTLTDRVFAIALERLATQFAKSRDCCPGAFSVTAFKLFASHLWILA